MCSFFQDIRPCNAFSSLLLCKTKQFPVATQEKLNYFMPGLAGPEYIDVWKLRIH